MTHYRRNGLLPLFSLLASTKLGVILHKIGLVFSSFGDLKGQDLTLKECKGQSLYKDANL